MGTFEAVPTKGATHAWTAELVSVRTCDSSIVYLQDQLLSPVGTAVEMSL